MDAGHSSSSQVAPVERRVAAIEAVFEQQGMEPKPFIETMTHAAEEEWVRGMAPGLSPRRGPIPHSVSGYWPTGKTPLVNSV
jgi:hypothetical protein